MRVRWKCEGVEWWGGSVRVRWKCEGKVEV